MNPLNTWKGKLEAASFFAVQESVQAVCLPISRLANRGRAFLKRIYKNWQGHKPEELVNNRCEYMPVFFAFLVGDAFFGDPTKRPGFSLAKLLATSSE
jgi:hypothetical protein